MSTPRDRGWGNPDAPNYRRDHVVVVQACGIRLAVRREVAGLFVGFLEDLCATGYRLDVVADDWGYANRCIRGTGAGTGRPCVKSNHSWGLAIDVNATVNPMTEAHSSHAGRPGHDDRGVHTDMPPETGALAAKWGLRWGANYSGTRKDAMHFEFMGTPRDVRRYPTSNPAPAVVPAAPAVYFPEENMRSTAIRIPLGQDGTGWVDVAVPAATVASITVNGMNIEGKPDTGAAIVVDHLQWGSGSRVVARASRPGTGLIDARVWTVEG